MVISWLRHHQAGGTAWGEVEAAQRDPQLPCLLVPQPAHSALAAELAANLLPNAFGALPAEIVRAIQLHDSGWAASDARQIQELRNLSGRPSKAVSFVAIPREEAGEAWTASIDTIEAITLVGATVVSRHFTLLAGHDQAHRKLVEAETKRRKRLEVATLSSGEKPSSSDLDRWTAALGFCDLLSLYLLSGGTGPVDLPLTHLSAEQSQAAPCVRLEVVNRYLHFSPPTLRVNCAFAVDALKHPLPAKGSRFETLRWQVL